MKNGTKKKIELSKNELKLQLKEQISFMQSSTIIYDQGKRNEAKRLSAILRILLHDTKFSKSILSQLDLKSIDFINTVRPYDPRNLLSFTGLIGFRFDIARRPWLIPIGTPREFPENKKLQFDEWWNMPVVVIKHTGEEIIFNRKDIVLHVADTDGGAHVDPALEKKYMALSRLNLAGITTGQDGIDKPTENPVFPCIRQITHEVLLSFENSIPDVFIEPYVYDDISSPPEGHPLKGESKEVSLSFEPVRKKE